jgi:hypothetical protein
MIRSQFESKKSTPILLSAGPWGKEEIVVIEMKGSERKCHAKRQNSRSQRLLHQLYRLIAEQL